MHTKLIAIGYGDLPATAADTDAVRERLCEAGAAAVQVNVDDAEVAAALRFGPGDGAGRPVASVVSVWTTDVGAACDALAADGRHVYRVTEHRRLDPPYVGDGVRADALANVALLRRPDGMSREEYLERWLVDHTPVAIRTQAAFGYVQNVVDEALTPGAPDLAGIAEELFPMAGMSDMHAFYGSGGDDAELGRRLTELMVSCARFGADTGLDLVPTSRYVWGRLS